MSVFKNTLKEMEKMIDKIESYIKDNNLTVTKTFNEILKYHSEQITQLKREIIIIESYETLKGFIYQNEFLTRETKDNYSDELKDMISNYYTLWNSIIKKIIESDRER